MKKELIKLGIKVLSFTLLFALLIQSLPAGTFKIGAPGQASQLSYPRGAYLDDATWADNSPNSVDLPPSLTYDENGLLIEAEYEYTPRAERQSPSAGSSPESSIPPELPSVPTFTLPVRTPEEESLHAAYIAILNTYEYYSELSEEEAEFLCEYADVTDPDLTDLEILGLTIMESLPYAKLAFEYDISAATLYTSFPTREELMGFSAQMRIYLSYVNEALYGSKLDIKLRGYLLEGYSFSQVTNAYGLS